MANAKLQDETLFCERCGISFLWSVEEQKAVAATGEEAQPPLYCTGCRHLLAPASRERGLVKWYNAQKRYGFITRRNAPEIYVHGTELQDQRRLAPGDLVEFSLGTGDRGPLAQAVQVLEKAEKTTTTGR
ncbi:MAG: cold shock domain-containing protein [Caldilineaceae bacterium]